MVSVLYIEVERVIGMKMEGRLAPRLGDWVSGISPQDERFIGFVESTDSEGFAKVFVTQSDNTAAIGSTLKASLKQMKTMPESALSEPESIRSLIDIALSTRDLAWFEDLAKQLASSQSSRASVQDDGFQTNDVGVRNGNRTRYRL
jgi:hypothetical protein